MEIDTLLSYIVRNCTRFMLPVYNSFLILYETGIRHSELKRENLILLPDNSFKVISKKRSENRIILSDSISQECYNLLCNFSNRDVITSRSVLYDYFLGISFPYRIIKNGNQVVLHSFRYNYIKKLYQLYGDYNLVQSIIGHKDLSHTIMYINSVLTVEKAIFIPEFLPGVLDYISSFSVFFTR